jgi:hypothetical protein
VRVSYFLFLVVNFAVLDHCKVEQDIVKLLLFSFLCNFTLVNFTLRQLCEKQLAKCVNGMVHTQIYVGFFVMCVITKTLNL